MTQAQAAHGGKFHSRRFVAPRYWPTWLGVGALWLLSRFPYPWQLAIGRKLGSLVARLMPSRRRVTQTNLALAFPDLSTDERERIGREVFQHIGMGLAEAACAWFRPLSFLEPWFSVEGLQHLQAAQARGKGVVILQAHFTLIEAACVIMGSRISLSAVVDRPKNELFGELLKYQRERYVAETIENHNIRRMVRRLRNQECVWYSPDLFVPPANGGIPTNYFGVPVLTTDGIARIVKLTGAAVVPYMPTRHSSTAKATLRFFPAIENFDISELARATQQMNDLFESQIRQQAEQYFWVHKRFKPPTPEVANPYK